MKKLKAILSIALMGVLIFSTLGFSVSRHYCMGMLVEESFYHLGSENCGMEARDDCWKSGESLGMDCCEDENLFISGIEVLRLDQKEQVANPDVDASFLTEKSQDLTQHQLLSELRGSPSPPAPKPDGRQTLVLLQRFLL